MPDDSSTPNINIIDIASDDTMWVLETDHAELLQVLADPVDWVHDNVTINDKPAVLWQPFVVVFHEVPPIGAKQTIFVQGINETAVLTVTYSQGSEVVMPENLLPANEVVSILQIGDKVYSHLEMKGFTSVQVAQSLFAAVTDPVVYLNALNQLPQISHGIPIPPADKKVFKIGENGSPKVVFQGWRPIFDPDKQGGLCGPEDCSMTTGDADADGNVYVDGVLVKTYSQPPGHGHGNGHGHGHGHGHGND